jgi:hypothetical protein
MRWITRDFDGACGDEMADDETALLLLEAANEMSLTTYLNDKNRCYFVLLCYVLRTSAYIYYMSLVLVVVEAGSRCPHPVTPRFKRGDLDYQPLYFHP